MTLTPTRTSGSAGIDRFSPEQLLRTARLFASDPDLTTLIDHQSGQRRWLELDSSPYLQIWLLSWPAGTGTGWHDHGQSAGAFLTVSGTLGEQTEHGHRHIRRTLTGGQGLAFPQNHRHNVFNVGLQTAFSVHLYTPRLTSMTRYAATPAGLPVTEVDQAGENW